MYAIIKTGGKQYRVEVGTELKVEKLKANVGDKITFTEVMAIGGETLQIGTPYVNCPVEAEVLEQGKGKKVIIYKYKAKKDYRKKMGHRQPYTLIKITAIGDEGKVEAEVVENVESVRVEEAPVEASVAEETVTVENETVPAEEVTTEEVVSVVDETAPVEEVITEEVASVEEIKPSMSMKKAELLELAESRGVKVSSSATKAEIIEAIENN